MLEKCDFEKFFFLKACVSSEKKIVKVGVEWGRTYRVCVNTCMVGKKKVGTNMFVSIRQWEAELFSLPRRVVYKKICHISQSLPPATLQHSTPHNSWLIMQCVPSLFPCLSDSLALSLSPYVAVGSGKTSNTRRKKKIKQEDKVEEKRNRRKGALKGRGKRRVKGMGGKKCRQKWDIL